MFDYHIHTTFSDGKNTIIEMIDTAESLDLKTISITDHIWKNSDWFDKYYFQIKEENEKRKINILIGFEAKALSLNGEIDATQFMCEIASIRIGAIHRIPSGKIKNSYLSEKDIKSDKLLAYKNWLITTINLLKNDKVDVVAHPCMVLNKYNLEHNIGDIYKLFKIAKAYNKKLEISSRYKESNIPLFDILKKHQNLLTYINYGSDAHSIYELKKAHNG